MNAFQTIQQAVAAVWPVRIRKKITAATRFQISGPGYANRKFSFSLSKIVSLAEDFLAAHPKASLTRTVETVFAKSNWSI